MITCHLRYVIDPYKLAEFEEYARLWIPIVNRMGGTHHGYFLPSEGANNIAVALFSFPSLAPTRTTGHASQAIRNVRRLSNSTNITAVSSAMNAASCGPCSADQTCARRL
ncbi:NIPSNAP family protein [Rhizobium aouanii]|uniref:NIPSNAP family protein n=1 Tax=Rhizobium aouanii TaxID=3118145 RepID=A0ABU8CE34_9HYPH